MFRAPFIVGELTEKNAKGIESRLFTDDDKIYFRRNDGFYNIVGEDGDDVTFVAKVTTKGVVTGLAPFNGNIQNFINGKLVIPKDEAQKWKGGKSIWITDGKFGYNFIANDENKDDTLIGVFIKGTINQVLSMTKGIQFLKPIDAFLFYHGFVNKSDSIPSMFEQSNLTSMNEPYDFGNSAIPFGDVFFGEAASSTKSQTKPAKTTKKKKAKPTEPSSNNQNASPSENTIADSNGFSVPATSAEDNMSGDEQGGESTGGVSESVAEPKEIFISLLPPIAAAPAAAPILLPDDTWIKIDARPFAARDIAGSLVLHTLAPDNYPFGAKVSMCFNCATELVLRFAPDLKKFGEFYNPTTGVERWNGRFVYKPETSLPLIDLKNDKTGVNPLTPEVWGTPPLENGVYVRKSIETPLELQILVIIDADAGEWIFGVLTR